MVTTKQWNQLKIDKYLDRRVYELRSRIGYDCQKKRGWFWNLRTDGYIGWTLPGLARECVVAAYIDAFVNRDVFFTTNPSHKAPCIDWRRYHQTDKLFGCPCYLVTLQLNRVYGGL